MPSTTHPEFDSKTEGLEVAAAFSEGIRGKTILVTGGNPNGIGFVTCQAFASQSPARLIIASRTPSKIEECIQLLKAEYPGVDYRPLIIDLSSQASVRAAASTVLSWDDVPTIDLLINSAGVMGLPERTLSADGIEMHFATNHLGHWLLACKLMPKLLAAAATSPKGATRIVNVTSLSPQIATMRWSDLNFSRANQDLPASEQPNYALLESWGYTNVRERAYFGLEGYNVSKVANVLCGIGATARLYEKHGILALAVHPGVVPTELGRSFPAEILEAVERMKGEGIFKYQTLAAGAATSLVAALDPKLGPGVTKDGKENYGAYLVDCQITDKAQPGAVSSEGGERLWKLSEELVGEKFEW